MRNGVLVGEDSPGALILKQNTETLEGAFLSLCCAQESGKVGIIQYCEIKLLENNFLISIIFVLCNTMCQSL